MMDPSSPVVCQIPDCTTTQAEMEAELKSFLSGYCSICKRDRDGKLCGCAYPCALTFRAKMLVKIHELLGIEKPADRRAIQVRSDSKRACISSIDFCLYFRSALSTPIC